MTAGLAAFDAPTRAWIENALRNPVDVFGEPVFVGATPRQSEILRAIAKRGAMRIGHVAHVICAPKGAKADHLTQLVSMGFIACDGEGFYSLKERADA